MSSILHIVANSVYHDNRVLKETRTLAEHFDLAKIEIAGITNSEAKYNDLFSHCSVSLVETKEIIGRGNIFGLIFLYLNWSFSIYRKYRKSAIDIIHCHDLVPLAVAVVLKKITGARLIYDAHELETETHNKRGVRGIFARCLETCLLRHVDSMITVSSSIKSWYSIRFKGGPIFVIRNVPDIRYSSVPAVNLKKKLEVSENSILCIYFGNLKEGKGIKEILTAMPKNEDKSMLFIGSGPLKDQVRAAAAQFPNIHYLAPVPPSEILSYARGADVGLCLTQDTCLSRRFSLPNKLFDMLAGELPVIGTDLPDISEIIKDRSVGWIVNGDSASLVRLLNRITFDDIRAMKRGFRGRVQDLTWDSEARFLVNAYRLAFKSHSLP